MKFYTACLFSRAGPIDEGTSVTDHLKIDAYAKRKRDQAVYSDEGKQQPIAWPSPSPHTTTLEDYAADFIDVEPLDQKVALSILNRREQHRSDTRPAHALETDSPAPKQRDIPDCMIGDPHQLQGIVLPNPQAFPEQIPSDTCELPMDHIHHQPETCAHGRSGRVACGQCAAVCPLGAIDTSKGDIRIDTEVCSGCALCTIVCPTGAMAVQQSRAQHLLATVKGRITDERKRCHVTPIVVFYLRGSDCASLPEDKVGLNRPVLRFPLTALGRAGPEVWLGAIAYGAHQVFLSLPDSAPDAWKQTLAGVHAWTQGALTAIGPRAGRIDVVFNDTPWFVDDEAEGNIHPPATFSPHQPKRDLIRCSIMHLAACESSSAKIVELPEGAPFGGVTVKTHCTLCTACAGVCPTSALSITGAASELRFEESACIQCQQCSNVCPENAIELFPRMIASSADDAAGQLLHAEESFACIGCGRPFASAGMVRKLTASLGQHWMYRKEKEKRLLKMCRECRIKALFQSSHTGN